MPDEHSVQKNILVGMNKVLLPPLLIKLALIQSFVKIRDKYGAAFQHLCTLFQALSSDKLKEGIFVGPHIPKVMKNKNFERLLTLKELGAWETFKLVCNNFLDNTQVLDYQACIKKLLQSYENMRCGISLKIYFLHFEP